MCLLNLNDKCMILLCCAVINPHRLNVTLFEKWPFTEIICYFLSRDIACLAVGSLQRLFPIGMIVFMNVMCCFLGLLSCIDVVQLWFI